MFHKANGDEVRSRIVARQYADGVFAPEHHAGTPPTWALKLVLSRMVSKSRTRQFASHDVSVAFFHAWLEQSVWVRLPKELRLGDDWPLARGEGALRHEGVEQGFSGRGVQHVPRV